MANPISLAASIAGILTLAVQVIKGLAQIISDAKAVDFVLAELTIDPRILCEILAKVEALSSRRESAADHLISTTLERCHGSLKELEGIIAMVQESVRKGRLYIGWVQVTWSRKQKQIERISANISQHKSTLTLTLGMQNALDMADVKQVLHTSWSRRTFASKGMNDRGEPWNMI